VVDVARLQVEVDSRQVRKANQNFDDFSKSGKRAGGQAEKFGRQTDKAGKSGKRFNSSLSNMKGLLAGLGITAAAASMLRFANSAISAANTIDNLSRTAGVSAETLQELRFAFGQLAGTTDTEVDAALRRFNRRLGLAADGGGAAKDTFEQLDISLTDTFGNVRSGESVLDELLSRLASIDNDSRRAALASQAFGEDAGPRLAAALGKGEEAVESLRNQAFVLEGDMIQTGSRISDELDRLFGDIRIAFQGAFLGFAADNEQEIRELFGVVLTGMATVVRASDQIAGPLGAGIMGRVLFGKKGMVIGSLLSATINTVNSVIDRLNENTGQALLRLQEREEQLQATIDSYPAAHPATRAALSDLERVRLKISELESTRMNSVEVENQYAEAVQNSSSATDDLADRLLKVRDNFLEANSAATSTGGAAGDRQSPMAKLSSEQEKALRVLAQYDEELEKSLDQKQKLEELTEAYETLGVESEKAGKLAAQVLDENTLTEFQQGVKNVADAIEGDLSSSLADVIMDVESLSDAFASLAEQIARTIIQQQITDPFAENIANFATQSAGNIFGGGSSSAPLPPGALGSSSAGGGGFFSGIGDFFGGFFANGGNVQGGTAAIVGERGPEMFVPGQDGRIIPNHQMGGGGDVTVNIINQGGEQLQSEKQEQRRGPNGDMTIDVMVKSSMDRLDSQGQLDGIFRRHGAQRQGQF